MASRIMARHPAGAESSAKLETNAWTGPWRAQTVATTGTPGFDPGMARKKSPPALYRRDPVSRVRFRPGPVPDAVDQPRPPVFSACSISTRWPGWIPPPRPLRRPVELGERAMYYTQRMPQLLSWQTEVLAYQLAGEPESRQVLSNAGPAGLVRRNFCQNRPAIAATDQRPAPGRHPAIARRSASQETEVRQTLNAGGDAATAINGAIKSLDEFVRYVSPPNTNKTAVSTNSRPFNVLDYGTAAGQVGNAAKDLNTLLSTMNQSTTQLAQLGQQTTADANRVVDHAFRRGLILILVLLIGSVVAGLTYRILANKLKRDGSQ